MAGHHDAELPRILEHARVSRLPNTAYYIPNFITEDEERLLLDKIASAPKPRWKQLTHRRLQAWPSELVQNKLLHAPLPAWLDDPVVTRLKSIPLSDADQTWLFEDSPHKGPNHVLINEYPPGDGAAYWPVVCTVSLGDSLCLNLYRSKEDGTVKTEPAWRVLQEPRSVLITMGDLYTDYLHGIEETLEDVNLGEESVVNWPLLNDCRTFSSGRHVRQTRTSLTYRDVLKVSKVGGKLGLLTKK
ncbi:uncharacterized protein F5Z01DRAFT_679943 [Emericellopsis atlantica]|uniref:Fe2OG dioxygenase domain-containing protein n=1 Tax=Emericellopsis atlantica TaxID=2614577 RepID=A0A9P7ZSA9_9HYPO|nr:uncharacterized protein F5Z01DRAFT_679943 [Emericellopsis atlantica]KAG9257320.1 hypothetical protein F5Z01DRAFT_679943 [Emericellopsis atlantica]